jgi:hypothetical protein
MNPLVHYVKHGAAEGRAPTAIFDNGRQTEHVQFKDITMPSSIWTRFKRGKALISRRTRIIPFAYWDSPDHSVLAPFISEWLAEFPKFRVLDDREVEPLINRIHPEHTNVYRRIRIPAAKSDIARLAALFEFGGLYIDCHCGLRDHSGLTFLLDRLRHFEVVLWQRSFIDRPRPKNEIRLINGIIIARPRSEIIQTILMAALANLRQHEREETCGNFRYDIAQMTGPGCFSEVLTVPGSGNTQLKPHLKDRIFFVPEDESPICRNKYIAYRRDEACHWSNRQKREPLFIR